MTSTVPNTSFYAHMQISPPPLIKWGLLRHKMALTYQSQAQLRVTNQDLGLPQSSISLISCD